MGCQGRRGNLHIFNMLQLLPMLRSLGKEQIREMQTALHNVRIPVDISAEPCTQLAIGVGGQCSSGGSLMYPAVGKVAMGPKDGSQPWCNGAGTRPCQSPPCQHGSHSRRFTAPPCCGGVNQPHTDTPTTTALLLPLHDTSPHDWFYT